MSNNVMQYESDVWKTADLLIGAGIKQSDFPKYMMPFFALIMVESRLIRYANELEQEIGEERNDDFIEEFKEEEIGYNDYVVRRNKTLKDICKNDKTFDVDFHEYLRAFDSHTRYLLGVEKGTNEEKFLDVSGVSSFLKGKKILMSTVKAWSEIDLVPYNNSEITTLEEHIKRRWADMSAETAGEQYTPDDVIALIAEIIIAKLNDNGKYLSIYDPTCGGGNLLFGVEDKINQVFERPTATFGEDWNDTLYALAKIESRFRKDAHIDYGNTLTRALHKGKEFGVIVANPPYGVDWKGYQKDIKQDSTGRFVALPSVSDGQLLFTQHIISHLAQEGLAIVVHNGSTLFSGDAGSGESKIRKHLLDQDYVEAIIQLPTDEFFNTGIHTYLWVFNKNKPSHCQDKVMLINASELWQGLKKSRGKKRREMLSEHRKQVVDTLLNFQDSPIAKVHDKWHFYYNKQAIRLTHLDENGLTLEKYLPRKNDKLAKSLKLNPVKVSQSFEDERSAIEITKFRFINGEPQHKQALDTLYDKLKQLDYTTGQLKVTTEDGSTYWYDSAQDTIMRKREEQIQALGKGKIVIKATYKKATKTLPGVLSVNLTLTPHYEKDYEIIPYHPNHTANLQAIANFMRQYITKPFVNLTREIGVEINFNKEFYQPEQLRTLPEILKDLATLNTQLNQLEGELEL